MDKEILPFSFTDVMCGRESSISQEWSKEWGRNYHSFLNTQNREHSLSLIPRSFLWSHSRGIDLPWRTLGIIEEGVNSPSSILLMVNCKRENSLTLNRRRKWGRSDWSSFIFSFSQFSDEEISHIQQQEGVVTFSFHQT